MDMIRRNTDYALRLMVNLAERFGREAVSSRILADKEDVSYQLACKLLQKLNAAGLVKSQMGPRGGFSLAQIPSRINLSQVVEAIQGPVSVNCCLLGKEACQRQSNCPISKKLAGLQDYIEGFLKSVTLEELSQSKDAKSKVRKIRKGKK